MKKNLEEINWLEDRLYGLSKIIERSIEGNWTGIKHNEWLEEVRDIIEQIRREERERVLNKIKLETKKENTKKEFQEIKELLKEISRKIEHHYCLTDEKLKDERQALISCIGGKLLEMYNDYIYYTRPHSWLEPLEDKKENAAKTLTEEEMKHRCVGAVTAIVKIQEFILKNYKDLINGKLTDLE